MVSPSIGRQFLEAAGLESVTGIIAATPYKQLSSPRWANDLALQLLLLEMSESMGNHDSEIVDAGRVD